MGTMSAEGEVCQIEAFSVHWAFTGKKSNDRSPNMGIWIATVFLKSSGKYAAKSEKLTVSLSPLSHLSTQTARKIFFLTLIAFSAPFLFFLHRFFLYFSHFFF